MNYAVELGRRERKRQAIHHTLLAAAAELFAEQGLARTTVDDIAAAADVARQTVFNHFPYKEVFALELAADGIWQVYAYAQALLENGSPSIEVFERVAQRMLDYFLQHGELAVVVARELLHPDAERAARAAERVPLYQMFEAILSHARDEGSVRADLPLDVVATRAGAVLISVVVQSLNSEANDVRRDLSVCMDILFHGITERRF